MTPVWLVWLEALTATSDQVVFAVARLSLLVAVVLLVVGAGIAPRVSGAGEVARRQTPDGAEQRSERR